MKRIQRVQLVLRLIDGFNHIPISPNQGRFTYNGLPVHPQKVTGPYVVFTDLLGNPRYQSQERMMEPGVLIYEHPHFHPVTVPTEAYHDTTGFAIRLFPRQGYPIKNDVTELVGRAGQAEEVALVHSKARAQFLLKEEAAGEGPLAIACSEEGELAGRTFSLENGESSEKIRLIKREESLFCHPPLKEKWPRGSLLYEVLTAPVVEGEFTLLLPPFQQDVSEKVQVTLFLHGDGGEEKKVALTIKKETHNEVSV